MILQNKVRSERRAKGIAPYLPPIEERDAIKAEYMKGKPQQSWFILILTYFLYNLNYTLRNLLSLATTLTDFCHYPLRQL